MYCLAWRCGASSRVLALFFCVLTLLCTRGAVVLVRVELLHFHDGGHDGDSFSHESSYENHNLNGRQAGYMLLLTVAMFAADIGITWYWSEYEREEKRELSCAARRSSSRLAAVQPQPSLALQHAGASCCPPASYLFHDVRALPVRASRRLVCACLPALPCVLFKQGRVTACCLSSLS